MANVRNKIDTIAYCKDILLDARERRLKNVEIKLLKEIFFKSKCTTDTAKLLADKLVNYQIKRQEQKERNKDFNNV